MNNLIRAAFRSSSMKALAMPFQHKISVQNAVLSRSLCHMSKTPSTLKYLEKKSMGCACGCGARFAHTDGEKELVNFLGDEIAGEKQIQSQITLPAQIEGFHVKVDEAEVELTKKTADETVVVKFNINHTVDASEPENFPIGESSEEKPDAKLESKPQFEVDIVRNDTTLSFTCSILSTEASEGEYEDLFGITELTIFKGEHAGEKVYACGGDVLDGYLYDLLMNYLEEKGISNGFVAKLISFSTDYERQQYINLLESLNKFVNGN